MEQYEDLCMRLYWDCQGLNTKLVEGGKESDRKKTIIAWLDTKDSLSTPGFLTLSQSTAGSM